MRNFPKNHFRFKIIIFNNRILKITWPKSDSKSSGSAKKETKSSSNFFAMPTIPLIKKTSNVAALIDGTSRVLKHSKSSTSSSSASSIVSGTGSSNVSKKSSSRFNGFMTNKSSSNELALLNSSTRSSGNKSKKNKQYPPNPYHVMTAALPVSVQDSELQSVVSGDIQVEDFEAKSQRKMDNTRYVTTVDLLFCVRSS